MGRDGLTLSSASLHVSAQERAPRSARQGNSMEAPVSRRAMPCAVQHEGQPTSGGRGGQGTRWAKTPRGLAALARTAFACVRTLADSSRMSWCRRKVQSSDTCRGASELRYT